MHICRLTYIDRGITMKNNKKMIALGTALVTLSGLSAATRAKGAAGTGNMSAVILEAIAITNLTTMNFGEFTYTAAGTVTISTAGVRGNTGGANPRAGSAVSQGVLDITSGAAGASTRIRIDPTAGPSFTVGHTTAADTMNVKSFTFAWNGAGPAATVTANMDTAQNINVGATLEVAGTEAAGKYVGTYVIEAAYQ